MLVACKKENSISYGPYQAISCESSRKNFFKEYIFNKKNGYLYFYEPKSDQFMPLNLRFEAGFFSEDIKEVTSRLKNNKLIITNIDYGNNTSELYNKVKYIIDLKKLVIKTIEQKGKKDYISYEKCYWIDPKLGIRY